MCVKNWERIKPFAYLYVTQIEGYNSFSAQNNDTASAEIFMKSGIYKLKCSNMGVIWSVNPTMRCF